MYIPGMITGVMQLALGIYGYFGAEQCDPRKVRNYFHWLVFTVGLEALYLIAGYLSVEQFCQDHNCEKADKGYCGSKVCAVFEDNHDNYQYYKLPCALSEGKPSHLECVKMFRQSIIIEICVIIPLYIYCALVVFSLHRKLLRGDIVPFEDDDSRSASTSNTTKVGGGSTVHVYVQPDVRPGVAVTVSDHERDGLLGNS